MIQTHELKMVSDNDKANAIEEYGLIGEIKHKTTV